MKSKFALIVAAALSFSLPASTLANPTQYGDSGLFSQPSAETLNAGNICIGLWTNCANGEDNASTLVPAALTLGLGTFMEMYGSYPNLLFNGDEGDQSKTYSGRGFANLGMKIRLLGKRAAPFKVAVDLQGRRSVSDDPKYDGINDYMARLIASFKAGRFGIHANGGYIDVGEPDLVNYEDQTVYGGGIEFFPMQRLRLLAEVEAQTSRIYRGEDPLEATAGFQYYLSPHLTLNVGIGYGLSDVSPEWRALVGFSTCQGIGSYSRPIPRKVEPVPEEEAAKAEPVKVMKVKTLTPLIPKAAPAPAAPVGRLEVPLETPNEEVLLLPSEKLVMPESAALAALPIAAIGTSEPMLAPASEPAAVAVAAAVATAGAPATLRTPVADPISVAVASTESTANTAGAPIKAFLYRKFRMPEFTYAHDQWNLSTAGESAILEIAEQLRSENKTFIIKVEGHTDSVGAENYNVRLSQKRAVSAATALVVKAGFDPNLIFLRGYGESKPLASNDTVDGRANNRRVEILVLLPKEGAE